MEQQYNIIFIDLEAGDVWHHKVDLVLESTPFADTYDSYIATNHIVGTPLALRLFKIRRRFHDRHWNRRTICPRYLTGINQYQAIYGKFTTT